MRYLQQLRASLGLAPGTPVIEWQRWGLQTAVDGELVGYGSGGWRYLLLPEHDASVHAAVDEAVHEWPIGVAPFANARTGGATAWPDYQVLWLRRELPPVDALSIAIKVEDHATVYVNGTQVLALPPLGGGSGYTDGATVDVPAEVLNVSGPNVLAIRCEDDLTHTSGNVTFADVQVTGHSPAGVWLIDPDRTQALLDYTVTSGGGPLQVSVRLARALLPEVLPTAGERFRLSLSSAAGAALGVPVAERPRFTGEVTDADVDAADELSVVAVTGVGRRARLGRTPVMTARPAELDGERVRRVLYQAAVTLPLDIGAIEPGTVTLLPATYTLGANAQGIIDQVEQDSMGQLVEHRSGQLRWHDAEHRRTQDSRVALTGADHIIRPFRWGQRVASVVNDAQVTYGAAEPRDSVRVTDPTSANVETGLGPYGVQLDTQLAAEADAYRVASTIVARYARPRWMLPDLTVDLVRSARIRLAKLLQLTVGDRITVTDLPPAGPFTEGDLFIEGTVETCTPTAWQLQLAVTEPSASGVGVRWLDVDPMLQWNDVTPGLRWLDVGPDPADLGIPTPDVVTAATVTIPAGKVASTLTGFVVRIDLAHMPASWWDDVADAAASPSGVGLRLSQTGTPLPFDLVSFDAVARTGKVWVRLPTLGTAGATVLVEGGATIDNPAETDPTGRRACWTDFAAVYIFDAGMADRAGKAGAATVRSGVLGTPVQPGWLNPNRSAVVQALGVGLLTQWTAAVSFIPRGALAQAGLISYSADSGTDSLRESVALDSGTKLATWNSTGGWLYYGGTSAATVNVAANTRERVHLVVNGTTQKQLFRNGVPGAIKTANAARPGAPGNALYIGAGDLSTVEQFRGDLNYAYLRPGLLSADWIAAETASWEHPETFYTVS